MKKTIALIVAGGSGSRFGDSIPKQYTNSILRNTILAFKRNPRIDSVQVVIREEDRELYLKTIKDLSLLPVVFGGTTRGESVKNGLKGILNHSPELVLIHDANRPYISLELTDKVIDQLYKHPNYGVIPIFPIVETVKKINEEEIEKVSRDNLFTLQTPQGFYFKQLYEKYLTTKEFFTDESNFDIPIKYIQGEKDNIKITFKEDLKMDIFTGIGFDAHKFILTESTENFIILGGIKIPYKYMIDAHSDGDVLIHAIVDALLGAMGKDDIGKHFPPSDIKWKNANSRIFLEYCKDLLNEQNGQINNIDTTIICEEPKISSYRELIKNNIALILDIDADRVNIKGTTTEKMGFTGRGEGIAVQAIASIKRVK